MSEYTIELRFILAHPEYVLGLSDYPIFNEEYRETLNHKITNHYFFHEIGFETPERFNFYLKNTMNEIMPMYNKLYQSELLIINPLLSFSRSSSANKDSGNTNTQTTNVDNTANITNDNTTTIGTDNKEIHSDTPQTVLSNADVFTNNFSATDTTLTHDVNTNVGHDVTENIDTADSTSTGTGTGTETTLVTESGHEVPLAELLLRYRETFLNIDMMIIDELKDLFMMIY